MSTFRVYIVYRDGDVLRIINQEVDVSNGLVFHILDLFDIQTDQVITVTISRE